MMDTGYDPFQALLEATAAIERLHQQQERMIAVINNQSQIIQAQAKFIEDFDRRITQLEEQHEK